MPVRFRLDNGLTVIFQEQRASHVAAFQIWVKVGSADERPDQAGLAHLHEHMLFKGTARRGLGEIARDIEAHGGEINAWTSFDQTVYHVVLASQFARTGLDVLADAVRNSAFDAGELAREIEVVCEEIKRSLDIPSRRASQSLFRTAFQTHPYGRPVIGTEESVRSFTREKVLEFYEAHYHPANMVLSAAGDISEADLRQWVTETLGGDWGRLGAAGAPRAQEPIPTQRRATAREEDIKEAYLHLAFPIPSLDHEDTPALDVLAMIVGQGDGSRLSLEVKRKLGLVNEISAYAYTPQDPGVFVASLTLPPVHAKEALEATARVLMTLREAPVAIDELRTIQALVESEAIYQRETVQGLARKLGFYETSGGIEREARYYEAVAALTPEQVRDVAHRYLRLERATLTLLAPTGAGLSERELEAVLERVEREPPPPPPVRKLASPASPVAMRVGAQRRTGSDIIVERLSSGAQVVIREEGAVPLFAIRAVFPGGLRYETEEANGITSLLSRTWTRGTPSHGAEEISHLVDDLAGSLSANGGRNSVSLRGEFLSRHFHRAFDLFADCVLNPAFPEQEVERERRLLVQDILTRDDRPSSVAMELFARTLFQRHPYRLSMHGETSSVEQLGPAELKMFHDSYLHPSRMTLCVVGDVRADEVLTLAERVFQKPTDAARPPHDVPAEPEITEPRVAKRSLQRAQSHLVLGFLGARITDTWRYALEVLSTVLSGQGGRLFLELRDKRSMAYSVSSFSMEGVDPGYFAVYIGTSPEKVDAAADGIRQELMRVREEPISEMELSRAQRNLIGRHEIGLQRAGARAALLGLDYSYGIGAESFLHYADRISKVSAREVQDVARRVIDFDRSVLVTVGP